MHKTSAAPSGLVAPALKLGAPERLVGLGFRLWLSGLKTGDISYWEKAWCAYSSSMGTQAAKSAVRDLSCWVRTIRHNSRRNLETAAAGCDGFCRDECVAIAMISACQHEACPAMRACAFALLGCSMIDEVVGGAESFARTLQGADRVLSPVAANTSALLSLPAASALRH